MYFRACGDDGESEHVIGFVLLPVILVAAVGMEFIAMRRCKARIRMWAMTSGVEVTACERLWLPTEAWFSRTGGLSMMARNHRYYRVTVTDPNGSSRRGTAKIGGGFDGIVADEIEVRWA